MKSFIVIFSALLLFTSFSYSQERRYHSSKAMKKIEELEKIKIIDALNLNEKTTLRFFARRNEYRNRQNKLMKDASNLLDQMDDIVKKDTNKNAPEYKKLIEQYLQIETKVINNRTDFINSLPDILTYQQISKLLIFEKKFREEIRNALFKDRGKWRR